MEFLNHNSTKDAQWRAYKQLELVPESLPKHDANNISFKLGLGWLWRGLLSLLMDELIDEQQVDYLERCWALNETRQADNPGNTMKRLWTLME